VNKWWLVFICTHRAPVLFSYVKWEPVHYSSFKIYLYMCLLLAITWQQPTCHVVYNFLNVVHDGHNSVYAVLE